MAVPPLPTARCAPRLKGRPRHAEQVEYQEQQQRLAKAKKLGAQQAAASSNEAPPAEEEDVVPVQRARHSSTPHARSPRQRLLHTHCSVHDALPPGTWQKRGGTRFV